MQALPPRHVYSAKVKNNASTRVSLKVTYEMPGGTNEVETHDIESGGTVELHQRTVEQGSAKFTAHIAKLEATCEGCKGHTVTAPMPGVVSPVKDIPVTIDASGDECMITLVV